jgi:hypothetical protein
MDIKDKKIGVIGGGTAGALTAFALSKLSNTNVDLYLDTNIKPQSVGEGANYFLAEELKSKNYFDESLLKKIGGTKKFGINKIDFSDGKEFMHEFQFGNYSLHFDSEKLRNYILNDYPLINVIEKNVKSFDDIDADFKWDCSGFPDINENDFHIMKGIPVNSSYITQCYWDETRFEHTNTVAMEHGWVFMVPLQNRCSVGYLYNSSISSEAEVAEDVKNIFKRFNLTPSKETNSVSFCNYYRKENFTWNTGYNGNASFFAEPLEATTIGNVITTAYSSMHILFNPAHATTMNAKYVKTQKETEVMIAFNYLMGSKHKSKFWEFAKNNSEEFLKENIDKEKLKEILHFYENVKNNTYYSAMKDPNYGTWPGSSWYQNINGFNAYDKLKSFL